MQLSDSLGTAAVSAGEILRFWPHIVALGTTTVAATGWWKTRLDIEKTRLEIDRLRREARAAAAERAQSPLVPATLEDLARYARVERLHNRSRAFSALFVAGLAGWTAMAVPRISSRDEEGPAMPPAYRVEIVEPAPGPRQPGVVAPGAPGASGTSPRTGGSEPGAGGPPAGGALPDPSIRPPTPRASAGPTPAAAPSAGAGPAGGRGVPVANVTIRGLDFPFPGYLQNVVRQVALRFTPPDADATRTADVAFLIHRDGSASDVRLVTRSGSSAFDVEAQHAIEAAGAARAFGPLPEAFRDDVLPVTFRVDPRVVR